MSNCKSFHEMAKLYSSGYTKDDYILFKFVIIEKQTCLSSELICIIQLSA